MLDDKLRLILKAVGDDFFFEGGEYDEKEYTDRIAQIKQAFVDEGYAKPDEVFDSVIDGLAKNGKKLTGQEWYNRFWIELTKTSAEDLAKHSELVLDYVMLAAKKASGL